MKIVTYNINGIRASAKLGLVDWIKEFNADVYCLQEVRSNEKIAEEVFMQSNEQISMFDAPKTKQLSDDYFFIYNCGTVPGYAGTLTITKKKPDKVLYDMGDFWHDEEGRTTTIFFADLVIVNAYIPNGNSRLDFKMQYLKALHKYLNSLQKEYNVVCVGDFNIAHNEIDLTNPKECNNRSVFLPIERKAFSELLNLNMIDCFRYLHPNLIEYSWRSYKSRQEDVRGYNSWKYRIDYILASEKLKDKITFCKILDLPYSDHLPVVLGI